MANAKEIPCWLCQSPLPIRLSKKGKPYLVCDKCGLQAFVRYRAGIDRLEQFSETNARHLDKFVVCRNCDVAVKRSLSKITEPYFSKAGIRCPSCEELLLNAPPDWRERLKD